MITLGQARYLFAIYNLNIRDRTVTKIAEVLAVSKPSVTNMINSFEEKGLVKKEPKLTLTHQGQVLASEMMDRHSILSTYYANELGFTKEEISDDILTLMFEVSEKFLVSLSKKIETDEGRVVLKEFLDSPYLSSFIGILSDGIFEIPFNLLKKNNGCISMGDKGFLHPARLVVVEGYGIIKLKAATITHRTLKGYIMKGRLLRLFYWTGECYTEVMEENGFYAFPVMDLHWGQNPEKGMDFGIVQIKVYASVGPINMPESFADLVFYF